MGIINKNLDRVIHPHGAKERNYALFGKKLVNRDSEIFNNFTEMSLNQLKTRFKIFGISFGLSIIIFLMTIFSQKEYWSIMIIITSILFLTTFNIYFIYFVPYIIIGLYERSWIKLLMHQELIPNLTFIQRITGKSTSIVYPKVKSYLETNNISLDITENEIRAIAPLYKKLGKLRKEHLKFDNSIIKPNKIT